MQWLILSQCMRQLENKKIPASSKVCRDFIGSYSIFYTMYIILFLFSPLSIYSSLSGVQQLPGRKDNPSRRKMDLVDRTVETTKTGIFCYGHGTYIRIIIMIFIFHGSKLQQFILLQSNHFHRTLSLRLLTLVLSG